MNLQNIQNVLQINHGTFLEEIEEQIMSSLYIKNNAKVLELGSNIGRNTLIISSILDNPKNLVTLEMDNIMYEKLLHNKNLNNLDFNSENAALSYRPLYFEEYVNNKSGGFTSPYKGNDNFKPCNIITFEELQNKYNIVFDTLVADCEGGLYYILVDNPNLLNNIHTLIIENDFPEINHKIYVDNILINNGFTCVYTKKLIGSNWPCKNNFWQTWIKN